MYLTDAANNWPTAKAVTGGANSQREARGAGGPDLQEAVQNWSTLSHSDGRRGGTGITEGMSGSSLTQKVAMRTTPQAHDLSPRGSGQVPTSKAGNACLAREAVAHTWHRPVPLTVTHGRLPSPHAPISRPLWALMTQSLPRGTCRRLWKTRSKRRLNPWFVEWLMAWPPGHALSSCSATAFTRWQQDMRGALSQLPTASGAWIWEPPAEVNETEQLALF